MTKELDFFVIEDDLGIVNVVIKSIERAFKDVDIVLKFTTAITAEEAVEMLKNKHFDLLIVDNHLTEKGMTGIDLINRIENEDETPIIFCSGEDKAVRFVKETVSPTKNIIGAFEKPLDVADFISTIQEEFALKCIQNT